MTKAIVSLSGGQDSATCLSWARSKFDEIYSISFYYGQKHQTEIECAEKLSKLANVKEHFIVRIDQLFDEINISNSAMIRSDKSVNENHHLLTHLPSTFVPFRNLFLLSAAAAKGLDYGINTIVTGICQTDYCIPENEFVNTNYGKIPISDVKCGDKVLSSDKNGNLSFKKVINKFNNGLRTDILEIETEAGRKIRVTSNHKIFKVERSNYSHKGWDKKIVKVRADCLKTGDYILNPSPIKDIYNKCDFSKTISNEIINKYENVDLLGYCDLDNPRLRYNDQYIWFRRDNLVNRYVNKNDLVKLIAWYTAEGNRGSGSAKNANSYRIGISQSRKSNAINYREIVQTAKKFGYNVTENKEMIFFSGPTTKIFEMCGELSDKRWIPIDFIYINMPLLFETLIEADGSISSNGSNDYYTFSTKSWTLKEQLCWMGTILGFSTGVHYNFEKKLYNVSMVKNHKKKMNRIGDLKMCKIKEIKEINEQPINVCDIKVEDNHNFITGLGSGILVLNSGYPDCREIFRYHLEETLSASVETQINVKAPLMFKTKAETVELMKELETLDWYKYTHTCYEGMRPACGKCPACKLRLKGFQEAGVKDPIEYLKRVN